MPVYLLEGLKGRKLIPVLVDSARAGSQCTRDFGLAKPDDAHFRFLDPNSSQINQVFDQISSFTIESAFHWHF